jgi:hypothetical protein
VPELERSGHLWVAVCVLIDWIESLGQRTVILHGHKHKYFVADLMDGQTTIVSAPSVTLGCEESFVKGFEHSDAGYWLDLTLNVRGTHTQLIGAEVRRSQPGCGA